MPSSRPTQFEANVPRALAFQRETIALVADEVKPIPAGAVFRTPSLRLVWALNQVRIVRPVGFEEAVALVDRHLGELPYRQLAVEDEETGMSLERKFRAAGWRAECEVTMILAGPPDREVDTSAVTEPAEGEVLELLKMWMREEHKPMLEGEDQLVEAWQREWRARRTRLLGIRGDSGALAAMTLLHSDGATAQVEDVYTVPDQRRRGFARALVSRAVGLADEAGHGLTFIVADDYGWPKQLYGRLGFVPGGRTWAFHREVRG